jgi:hypothetical protein
MEIGHEWPQQRAKHDRANDSYCASIAHQDTHCEYGCERQHHEQPRSEPVHDLSSQVWFSFL